MIVPVVPLDLVGPVECVQAANDKVSRRIANALRDIVTGSKKKLRNTRTGRYQRTTHSSAVEALLSQFTLEMSSKKKNNMLAARTTKLPVLHTLMQLR